MTPLLRKFLGMNWILFATMAGLLIFGVFAIYSACWMRQAEGLDDKWRDQIIFIVIGLVVFFAASLIDYRWVNWIGIPFYLFGIGLLVYTMVAGQEIYGQKGWLRIGGFQFQPSQVAIAGGIIVMALILSHLHRLHPIFRNHFLRLIIAGLAGGIPFLLVLATGDFGSAIVWLPVIGAMVIVGSIPFRYLIVILLCGTMLLPYAYFFGLKDYQKKRITVQIDMLMGRKVDTLGAAYSAHYNLLAIGSGGFAGKGFKSTDTINYKKFISPNTAINDFVFAVLAEEHGFRGAILMLSGFLLMLLQCLFVAFYSRDMLGRLIVAGVVGLFFAHIFQNVGMNLLIMPITGIPLPLISYGGTFVIIIMFLLGLVQSVWVHRGLEETVIEKPKGLEIDHLS
ncbi:MAG: FtsW/RodA/SpoVE family cell cycle protein [Verrucomicrobiae bacterium]|nr:FtsW/RodA/SpoVE family cell cycle protein [Verrucomicrobiae bacterium]